jgi:RNA polymerase sigma factor (sigma-70 family)
MPIPNTNNTPVEETHKSDRDLIRLYAEQKSEAAFAALGRRYATLVYSVCLGEVGESALAEDAAQGVFLLLARKAPTLKRHDSLAGWLYRAARYVARNVARQERRRQNLEMTAHDHAAPPSSSSNALWDQIEPHWHAALERLKPAEQEAVLLRFVQQQSFAEVGSVLGISENGARMRVTRALDKIRAHFAKAGIAVTVGALAVLLERQAAVAAPPPLIASLARTGNGFGVRPFSPRVRQSARAAETALLASAIGTKLSVVCAVAMIVWGGATVSRWFHPTRLSLAEQEQFITAVQGTWQGNLEFVDDRTLRRFSYSTVVRFERGTVSGDFEITATYSGDSHVDETIFRQDTKGKFRAKWSLSVCPTEPSDLWGWKPHATRHSVCGSNCKPTP